MKKITYIGLLLIASNSINAQVWEKVTAKRLEGNVNSEADETMPIFSKDSSTLFFTRTYSTKNVGGKYDQDIWQSKKNEDSSYDEGKNVTDLNNKFNNTLFGLSIDGSKAYLLDAYEGKKDQLKGCAISTSTEKKWGKPKHINVPTLDIEGDSYSFNMSSDENILIISNKGIGTIGLEDLYVSKKENESWTTPIHMGNQINTEGFEISPFLSKGMDTLFFSSNGFGGQGDADIFYSVRLDNSWTNWSTPVNLGSRINSPKFDAYFSMSGINMYWSSNRDGENNDIYYAYLEPVPPLKCNTIPTCATTYEGKDGKATVEVTGGLEPYSFLWSTGSTEKEVTNLAKGDYTITITDSKGQKCEATAQICEPELVAGTEIGEIIHLNPIYFDMAKWDIRPDAAKELDKIVAILNQNPNMVVELGSHTDCRSSVTYNEKLSEKRATSSVTYIRKKIVNPDRIYGKGYGESQLLTNCPCEAPVFSLCSEEEHQKNRRTEFVVISKDGYKKGMKYNAQNSSALKVRQNNIEINNKNTIVYNNVKVNANNNKVVSPYINSIPPLTDVEKENIANGFYIVKSKETLYRVSKYTNVSIEMLQKLNNLNGNNISTGQKLKLK